MEKCVTFNMLRVSPLTASGGFGRWVVGGQNSESTHYRNSVSTGSTKGQGIANIGDFGHEALGCLWVNSEYMF